MTPNPVPRSFVSCGEAVNLPAPEAVTERFAELFPRVDMEKLDVAAQDGGLLVTYSEGKASIAAVETAPEALADGAAFVEITGLEHGAEAEHPAELCLLVSLLASTIADLCDGQQIMWCGIDRVNEASTFIRGMQFVFQGQLPVELWLAFPTEKREDGRLTMQSDGLKVFTGGWELASDFAHPKEDWLQSRFALVAAHIMQGGLPTEGQKLNLKKMGKVYLSLDEDAKQVRLDPSKTKGAKGRFGLIKG